MKLKLIRKILPFSFCILSAAFLSNAFADTEFYNAHEGFYVAGNGGISLGDKVKKSGQASSGFMGGAASVFIARQFKKYFALEGGFAYYGSKLGETTVFDVVGKGILPLGSRVMLFGKLGAAYAQLSTCFLGCDTQNQITPAFGLGMGVGITKKWAGTLEYNGIYLSSSRSSGLLGGLTVGATRYFDA